MISVYPRHPLFIADKDCSIANLGDIFSPHLVIVLLLVVVVVVVGDGWCVIAGRRYLELKMLYIIVSSISTFGASVVQR